MSMVPLHSKTETSCNESLDPPGLDPPKVLKVFNRVLLFDGVSRADPEALSGLLEYLQGHEKRLTDEEFKGETTPLVVWWVEPCGAKYLLSQLSLPNAERSEEKRESVCLLN